MNKKSKIKLPEGFDVWINVKQALMNGAGAFLFLKLVLAISDPTLLTAGVLFGLFGGSVNDIIGWRRNKEAIRANPKTKKEGGK